MSALKLSLGVISGLPIGILVIAIFTAQRLASIFLHTFFTHYHCVLESGVSKVEVVVRSILSKGFELSLILAPHSITIQC